jgi:hypothetical protein
MLNHSFALFAWTREKCKAHSGVRSSIKFALGAAILLCIAVYFLVDTIPPRSMTVTGMNILKREIIEYAHQHNSLPANLSELPPDQNHGRTFIDGWGRTFDYRVDSARVVTLQSLGADKKPGGTGEDRDIVGIFSTRDSKGQWQEYYKCPWIKDPSFPKVN